MECLVALIRACFRSSNLTGKRRREMTGVSRVLGRLIRTCCRSSNLPGKGRRHMTGVSRVLGRLDLAEHLPAP